MVLTVSVWDKLNSEPTEFILSLGKIIWRQNSDLSDHKPQVVLEKSIKSNKQQVKEYAEISYHEKFTAVFGEVCLHPPA